MATQVSLNSGAIASAGALAIQTNGTTQAVSISTGQVATVAQNPILTSGTANGVAYLDGSKVLTTGSALVFDGNSFVAQGAAAYQGNFQQTNANSYGEIRVTGSSRGGQIEFMNGATRLAGMYADTSNNLIFVNGTGDTERARIDSSGNLLVGTTTKSGAWGLFSLRNASNASNQTWGIGPDTNNSLTIYNQSNVGQYMTDGGTSWIATSDETLKENLTLIENAIEKVCSLRSVVGNYITDKNKTKHPFLIAQDVQRVLPEAISEGLDGTLGLSYTEVIPLLVAAIKEQQALITQLTARITALESA